MRGIKPPEHHPIALISTDFDGTLVCGTQNPPFPDKLRSVLSGLRERGVYWVINTGRPLDMAMEGVAAYIAPDQPDFIISSEREIHRPDGEDGWIDHTDWNRICRDSHDELYASLDGFFPQVTGFLSANPDSGRAIEWEGRVEGIIAESEEGMGKFVSFLDVLASDWPQLGWQRNSIYLRFCHRDFHKGSALGALAANLGIGREAIFAAGDNHNDLSMLDGEYAGWVACPSNSVDEVKETVRKAGGYVAKGYAGLGVAEALEYFCGLR